MKYVSSSIRKFVCRWVGVLLILVPFIGVPKSWKDSIILIFAIVLLFASFSFDERQKQKTKQQPEDMEDEEAEIQQEDDLFVAQDQAPNTLNDTIGDSEEGEYVDADDEYEQRPL